MKITMFDAGKGDCILIQSENTNILIDGGSRASYDNWFPIIEKVKKLDGIFIQEMATAGREAILGMNRDPKFGALLMFGLGGSWVEVFKDVSFRLAPITKRSAQHMIESTKFSEILKGARGKKPVNMHELEEILCRLSQLVTRHPQIAELDINPLIIYEKNSVAVDARIQLVN